MFQRPKRGRASEVGQTKVCPTLRAVLYRCPDIARPDSVANTRRLSRQVDFEFRSFSYFAEEADEAAVYANYGQDGAQPQPSPLSLLFRREERVEDARDDFARYARACVGHGDADIPLLRRARR